MKSNNRDYTQTKDAYEGNRESAVYRDSSLPQEKKPGKDSKDSESTSSGSVPRQ